MEKEIEYLKEKIKFLELLLEVNSGTLEKAIETNRVLIEELKRELCKLSMIWVYLLVLLLFGIQSHCQFQKLVL